MSVIGGAPTVRTVGNETDLVVFWFSVPRQRETIENGAFDERQTNGNGSDYAHGACTFLADSGPVSVSRRRSGRTVGAVVPSERSYRRSGRTAGAVVPPALRCGLD